MPAFRRLGGKGHGLPGGSLSGIGRSRTLSLGVHRHSTAGGGGKGDVQLVQLRRFGVGTGKYQGTCANLGHLQGESDGMGFPGLVPGTGYHFSGCNLPIRLRPGQLVLGVAAAEGGGNGVGAGNLCHIGEGDGILLVQAVDVLPVAGPAGLGYLQRPLSVAGQLYIVKLSKFRFQSKGDTPLVRQVEGVVLGVLLPLHQKVSGFQQGEVGVRDFTLGGAFRLEHCLGSLQSLGKVLPAAYKPTFRQALDFLHQRLQFFLFHGVPVPDGDGGYRIKAQNQALFLGGQLDGKVPVSRHIGIAPGFHRGGFLRLARLEGDFRNQFGVKVVLDGAAGVGGKPDGDALVGVGTAYPHHLDLHPLIFAHGIAVHLQTHHTQAVVVDDIGRLHADGLGGDPQLQGMLPMGQVGRGENHLSQGTGGGRRIDGGYLLAVDIHIRLAVVGVLGTHEINLAAGEGGGEAGAGIGPLVGAADELGAGFIRPAGAEGEGGVGDVQHIHALGSCPGKLEALAGLVDAHLAEHGHLPLGDGDGNAHLVALYDAGAAQPLAADGLAGSQLMPLPRSIPVFHQVLVDSLAELDSLLNGHHIEALNAAQIQQQRAGIGAVVGGPVGAVLSVHGVAGLVSQVVAPDAVGGSGLHQVVGKGLTHILPELRHPVQNGLVYGTHIVGGDIQQECGVVSHGAEVHIRQGRNGLGGVLGGAPEPAGGNPGVRLGNRPLVAVFQTDGVASLGIAVDGVGGLVHLGLRPGVFMGVAVLVANPPDGGVGLGAEEHTVGVKTGGLALMALDGFKPAFKIILLSVGAGTLGAVHPHLPEVSVVAVDLVA